MPSWPEEARGRGGYWNPEREALGRRLSGRAPPLGEDEAARQSDWEGRELRGTGETSLLLSSDFSPMLLLAKS